jgi:hypothetical protein
MLVDVDAIRGEPGSRFKVFHELMFRKIREILLISSPYDAWIMEEDGRLSERIINEYRGLNLSHPPRLNWVSSLDQALAALKEKKFDLVIVMPREAHIQAEAIGDRIKRLAPDLPVMLLSHMGLPDQNCGLEEKESQAIDGVFVWNGNTDLLLALVKNAEDQMNVARDTQVAGIRVIIFVEDSPVYRSSLLPILYKELVLQTQSVMEEGLNEEHRLLAMRARPKVLVAKCYEEAITLFNQFEPFVLGVISDVRFPQSGRLADRAGIDLLRKIRRERFDIPLLLTSSAPRNAAEAALIPAVFVDKNSPTLHHEVRAFFQEYLGFGDFIFRRPDGWEIARARNLRSMEIHLARIPEDSFTFHTTRNDFSRWLFARTEIDLASRVRPIREDDFPNIQSHREHLVALIHGRRMRRQKGVVVNFEARDLDADTEFWKIGQGSLGGKARGLAFVSAFLQRRSDIFRKYRQVDIHVPQTMVITTEAFEVFVERSDLRTLAKADVSDQDVARAFLNAPMPDGIVTDLAAFLAVARYPLAVRSSSLLEDAQYRAYAGLYKTYMLPNDDPDPQKRLAQLLEAVRLVWASTYFKGPKAFSHRVGHRTEEEKMAVVIQRVVGRREGSFWYPAVSGVAQSYNYYPFARMRSEDGIAVIALGLGKQVMDGKKALRFCPRYPDLMPQKSSVDDVLRNAQNYFYALQLDTPCPHLGLRDEITLARREVQDAVDETAVRLLASTYIHEEHRLRDTTTIPGPRVLTFASLLKYKTFPLADILQDVLALGVEGMGCQVELEFSVNLASDGGRPQFAVLQLRPMTAREGQSLVDINEDEKRQAFCYSSRALGNGIRTDIRDILFVRPDTFDPSATPEVAREIGRLNAHLLERNRPYLLVGPGRWGSADRWLGIPVAWEDISAVGAMVETGHPQLKAEPSQGSHFFHNITTLGINYITLDEDKGDFFNWRMLDQKPKAAQFKYTAHVALDTPLTLKVDGRTFECVMLLTDPDAA